MELTSINSSSINQPSYHDIFKFCKEAENEGLDASVNMTVNEWCYNDACLLYLLYVEKRFNV